MIRILKVTTSLMVLVASISGAAQAQREGDAGDRFDRKEVLRETAERREQQALQAKKDEAARVKREAVARREAAERLSDHFHESSQSQQNLTNLASYSQEQRVVNYQGKIIKLTVYFIEKTVLQKLLGRPLGGIIYSENLGIGFATYQANPRADRIRETEWQENEALNSKEFNDTMREMRERLDQLKKSGETYRFPF